MLVAQQQPSSETVSRILDRLDRLEKQNEEVLSEIRSLREELEKPGTAAAQPASPPLDERVNAAEQRIREQAQTKVEASQRFPITLTGTFLFDTFAAKGSNNPFFLDAYSEYALGTPGAGATLNQSIIGLDFRGPVLPAGGRVNGTLTMDFYGGSDSAYMFRIRRGFVAFEWKNRSIILGQDKSIVAPLQPTSFARVGVPPLAGSGNLWLWRPQITYEERIPFSNLTKATLQASVFETDESHTLASETQGYYPKARPAVQARAQIQHAWTEDLRISAAVSGSGSTSHILGQSVPSRVISADFVVKPMSWFELSGTIFRGKNFASLGGLPNGVTVFTQTVVPIRGSGGWLQAAFPVTNRLTLDVYAGKQVNNPRDLSAFEVLRSQTFAANALYRIAPNVVLGFEAGRNNIGYLNALKFWSNRYDATVAYLF
jgi:hypothetical protein